MLYPHSYAYRKKFPEKVTHHKIAQSQVRLTLELLNFGFVKSNVHFLAAPRWHHFSCYKPFPYNLLLWTPLSFLSWFTFLLAPYFDFLNVRDLATLTLIDAYGVWFATGLLFSCTQICCLQHFSIIALIISLTLVFPNQDFVYSSKPIFLISKILINICILYENINVMLIILLLERHVSN